MLATYAGRLLGCFLSGLILLAWSSVASAQGGVLAGATFTGVELHANDAVYDTKRERFYVSVGEAGEAPYRNRLLIVDGATLEVLDSLDVGPEPNRLGLTGNFRRLYVGVDGLNSFRWLDLVTGELSEAYFIRDWLDGNYPTAARQFAFAPGSARSVVVLEDTLGVTSVGELSVYDDDGLVSEIIDVNGPTSIGFIDAQTLVGFDSEEGFEFHKYSFDGSTVTEVDMEYDLLFGYRVEMKVAGGLAYGSDGGIVDPVTMTAVGEFPGDRGSNPRIAVNPVEGTTFFLSQQVLYLYENETLSLLDQITLAGSFSESPVIERFENCGVGRLFFVDGNGQLCVISSVPASPLPLAPLVVTGGPGDDLVVLDLEMGTLTINGLARDVSGYDDIFFSDFQGNNKLICRGERALYEQAYLTPGRFQLLSEGLSFDGRRFTEIEFDGGGEQDVAYLYGVGMNGPFDARPGLAVMPTAGALLGARGVGSVYAYAYDGNTEAVLSGSAGNDRLNGSLEGNRYRLTSSDYLLSASGFKKVVVNAGQAGDDRASILDAAGNDQVIANGNFVRLFRPLVDLRMRNFEQVTVTGSSGFDRATFQKLPGDRVLQRSGETTVAGAGYWNSVRNFDEIQIRE